MASIYRRKDKYKEVLYHGISEGAFHAKDSLLFVRLAFSLKIKTERFFGGASGTLFYGSLYVDSL